MSSVAPNKFCTVVTCMDGRIQDSVAAFMREHFQAQWVDTITDAGPIGALSEGNPASTKTVAKNVSISIEKHASVGIGVVAHEGCAAVPGGQQEQAPLALNTAARLGKKFPEMEIIVLWAKLDGTVVKLS